MGVVSLLSVMTLRQAGAGADALVTGQALVAVYDWTYVFGPGFRACLGRRDSGFEPARVRCSQRRQLIGGSPRSTTERAVVRLSGDPALLEAARRPYLETAKAERTIDHQ